jgi:PEP-CTERM motif-containing protein
VTSVALGYDTGVGTDSYNGPAGATDAGTPASHVPDTDIDTVALGDLGVKAAAFDFAASPGGLNNNTRFQIQGLNPNEKYTLKLFGSHKFSDDSETVYSIFSDNTYSTLVASEKLNVQDPLSPNLHNRNTVATISNLSPQTGNILYVQFVGNTGNQGYLNSFELTGTAVPEPTSMLLLASGAALAFGYRRRY